MEHLILLFTFLTSLSHKYHIIGFVLGVSEYEKVICCWILIEISHTIVLRWLHWPPPWNTDKTSLYLYCDFPPMTFWSPCYIYIHWTNPAIPTRYWHQCEFDPDKLHSGLESSMRTVQLLVLTIASLSLLVYILVHCLWKQEYEMSAFFKLN